METLALGINMRPNGIAGAVVKFSGEPHMPSMPGSTPSLTGRAGVAASMSRATRWRCRHPEIDPAEVAGLASTRTFPLRSSFAPTYNMTIDLVNQMGPTQAHKLLESSSRNTRPTARWSGWCAPSSAANEYSTR